MNTKQENVLMDSCQYTPVYLVENTGAIQGRSFILTQANVEESKPVTDNLKRYYENSGILEPSFENIVPTFSKPRILKRQERLVGKNLKLASFLLPKSSSQEIVSRQPTPVHNVRTGQTNNLQTTPINYIHTTPVNSVRTTPVNIHTTSVNNVHTTPVNKVHTTPVNTVHNTPVNNVHTTPVNKVHTTPVNKVHTTPVNKVHTTPVNKVHTTPVNKVHTTPVNTVQTTPVHSVQTIPVDNIQTTPINNVVYKPVTTSVVHTVPKVEVERKIVRLKNFPSKLKAIREKIPPKTKPKDDPPNLNFSPPNLNFSPQNPIKHTSVQLLKLGETYHSLNQLSDDQMKMVNKALKIFSNPENGSMEPTYDPVTNTQFIYKVVSPRDLTVVGKNKLKREEIRKEVIVKELKREPKKVIKEEEVEPEPPVTVPEEVKVTRSGRKVKFTKQIVEEIPQKPKKKNGAVVSCFQCSTEFCSLYRLQKHYENHPTHIPAKIHSNLFYCLLAIIKSGSEEDKTNIFIQQLEQLIEKLKSLLPCLLKKIDGDEGKPCMINDNVGRLFGMNPGKYNLNMDGLTCVKDKDGNCRHNPPPPKCNFSLDLNQRHPSPLCHTNQHDESTNENETEDCARINSVDKWPIANKRFRKIKQQKTLEMNAKRMKLASESNETIIELDDFVISNSNFIPMEQSVINVQTKAISLLDSFIDKESENCIQQPVLVVNDTQKNTTGPDLPSVVAIDKRPIPNRRLKTIKKQIPQEINTKRNKQTSETTERAIELDDFVICDSNFTIPMKHNANNVQSETISLLENFIDEETDNCIEQPVGVTEDTQKSTAISDLPKKEKGAYTQFHSAHFDIRSSPIKTSSAATFRKFQINPEKLAKYEVQIIRPLELDKNTEEVDTNSKADTTHSKAEIIQNEEGILKDSAITSIPDNSVLQSIFRDDLIELTCKDPNEIPNDLAFAAAKEWISSGLNSVDGKSVDDDFIETNSLDESFIRGSSLLESALLHCKEDSHDKLVLGSEMTADHLAGNDNHLLNQNSASVLNFLDSLGSECLSYPETEIRNNNVDFQLDLFSFSNT